ncbi:protein of unknown function [Paraburkholderia dioscoreae]|uniref:Uncharacterized protein n=1 Tax=Paraburkholderia dioscoreae TaxID=2604047 RepID=A0A5Q4ZKC6_9BURK|nr:protein of unknown function [Paraburkholderia dioscoreae]
MGGHHKAGKIKGFGAHSASLRLRSTLFYARLGSKKPAEGVPDKALKAPTTSQWVQPMMAKAGPQLAAIRGELEQVKPLKALRLLVRPAGIEPATPAFGGQYSIH